MSMTEAKSTSPASNRRAPPATMTIFGAAGDLTKRLVVPALYNLVRAGRLPDEFSIVGVDHNPFTTETWRQSLSDEVRNLARRGGGESRAQETDSRALDWITSRMRYLRGDYLDPETYGQLAGVLREQAREHGTGGNVLFYLATADRFFCPIIQQLGRAGLARQSEGAWRRVVVEKPFGHDLPSAKELNAGILKVLSEDQIYRIDHFLGKEPVQNIMVLALRERHLRAALEARSHRSCADHRRGDHRRRGARPASTSEPARCGTWCRTICSSSWP